MPPQFGTPLTMEYEPRDEPRTPITVRAGYNNQYGTNISVTGDPIGKSIGAEAQFPVGSHRSGMYAGLSGGYDPERGGFRAGVEFGKRNVPSVTPQDVDAQVGGDPNLRVLRETDPEAYRKLLERLGKREVDRQMGVDQPGTPKYSFSLGVEQGSPGFGRRPSRGRGRFAGEIPEIEPYLYDSIPEGVIPARR